MIDNYKTVLSNYNTIVFDFDGVIVDSNELKRNLFIEIWDGYNIDTNLIREIISQKGNRNTYIKLIYDLVSKKNVLLYDVDYFIQYYTKLAEDKIVNQGINSWVLEILSNFQGKKFINSATPTNTLIDICKKLDIYKYFNEILGLENTKIDNFKYIFTKYKIPAYEIVFLGDMYSDKQVAEQLSIDFISIYSKGSDLVK